MRSCENYIATALFRSTSEDATCPKVPHEWTTCAIVTLFLLNKEEVKGFSTVMPSTLDLLRFLFSIALAPILFYS